MGSSFMAHVVGFTVSLSRFAIGCGSVVMSVSNYSLSQNPSFSRRNTSRTPDTGNSANMSALVPINYSLNSDKCVLHGLVSANRAQPS